MSLNTTPRTWVSGEVVTAAEMNTEVRDALTGIQSAWSTYVSVWTGTTTNPTLGNGTITGRWIQRGKTYDFLIQTTLGSTTTVGSGSYRWSLPATPLAGAHTPLGVGMFYDSSATTDLTRVAVLTSGSLVLLADAAGVNVGAAAPAVPAVSDILSISGTVETP